MWTDLQCRIFDPADFVTRPIRPTERIPFVAPHVAIPAFPVMFPPDISMASIDPMQSTQEISLIQISYAVAYFVLPQYAFHRLHKVEELCHNNPATAGAFFYAMACQLKKSTPDRQDAGLFSWQVGELDENIEFFVMVHPRPEPQLDEPSGFEPDERREITLAPYFSGIFRHRQTQKVDYYVLSQAPFGDGTTLRSISLDPMVNANLGPGPEPDLDSFLASVTFRLES